MNFTIITKPSSKCNFSFYRYPRFDFFAAIRAEGEPVTFQVGGAAFSGTAAFAGVPGGLDGLVYELSDILWSVVVIDSESAKLLFDLRDFDGRVRVCGVEGIDGRCDFLDQRPPSFSALPGNLGDFACHRSEVLNRRGQRASTAIMVRPMKWPFGARLGSEVCSW